MGNAIDRLLLGGAFVFGGLIHRKVGQVDDRVGLVEDVVEDLALSPQVPGMPLPTGYGLQVKGPASEDILIPVCLPPGFELGSLVLKPSFLPDEEQSAESAPRRRRRRSAVAARRAAAGAGGRASNDRLGEAIQLVYSEESAFRTGGEGLASPAPPKWSSGTPRSCEKCLTSVRDLFPSRSARITRNPAPVARPARLPFQKRSGV